ncbi:hypothetical protein BGX30_007242 [Mortierella sp. GBA39]|nr:hypothetical protein BGX30_007242 [Mortierella sp. GBA39]
MTSTRVPLPPSINQIIVLDDTPFGLQKEDGPPPLLYIIAVVGGVAGLAILGCLIRSIFQSVQGSFAWASRNHRLPSEGKEHYDDKDQYSHSITDAKYVADPEAISGVTVVKVPARFTSAHCLPSPRYSSTYSLDYATLPHSFLNNSQEPTTTTVPIDSSSKLSNETQMLGQTNVSDGSELQKSRSLHARRSEALLSLPQLPVVATMKGSRSPAVTITTHSDDVSPSPSLSSLKSPRIKIDNPHHPLSSSPTLIHIYANITLRTCLIPLLNISVIKLYARIPVELWRRILQQYCWPETASRLRVIARRTTSNFYEHSRNAEGLIRRCGGGLSNPYGPSSQYEPNDGSGTRHYYGTTYYGGSTQVANGTTRIVSATAIVSGTTILLGTTTWVSGTPSIIGGTSTALGRGTRIIDGTTFIGGQTGVVSGTTRIIATSVVTTGYTRIISATAIVNGTTIRGGTTHWISETPVVVTGTSRTKSVPTNTSHSRSHSQSNSQSYSQSNSHSRTRSQSSSSTSSTSSHHHLPIVIPTFSKTKSSSSVVVVPTSSPPVSRIPTNVATVITRSSSVGPAVTTTVRTRTTNVADSTTAQPIVAPSPVPTDIPISAQSKRMSGGAIAGTVLGILGALGLAGLLGWCWRRNRAAHVPAVSTTTHVGHGATRTVVSEKIEPLVVKSVNADQTYHATSVPVAVTAAGAGAAAGAAGGAAYASRSQPAGSNTSYTTTTSGVPAAFTSHVQTGTTTNYTTTGTSNIHAPSGQTTSYIGQPGSTTTYNTTSSSGGNTHVQPGVSSTAYSTSGQQIAGATNASTTYTSGSSAGHTTTQPGSTTNTTYNTTTPGGNATTTGSENASQTGNNSTIYSSNNGYNPKPHN